MVQLLASPGRFEGMRIRVLGYCHLEFEDQGLYLHREDSDQMNSMNGVWLSLGDKEAKVRRDGYVIVEGTFTEKSRGHQDVWRGTLHTITRLERLPSRADLGRIRKRGSRR